MASAVTRKPLRIFSLEQLSEVATEVLRPIGYRITEEIFEQCIPRRAHQRVLKDRILEQISDTMSVLILEDLSHLDDDGTKRSELHTRISEAILEVICPMLPKDTPEMRLKVKSVLDSATFPNNSDIQALLLEKIALANTMYPHYFVDIFPMEGILECQLATLFEASLNEEGRKLLEKDPKGAEFTIDHISEKVRERFLERLTAICIEFTEEITLENACRRVIDREKGFTPEDKAVIRRRVDRVIGQFKEGVPLLKLLERTDRYCERRMDHILYQKAKEILPPKDVGHIVTKARLKRKAKMNHAIRIAEEVEDSVEQWVDCFRGKTEKELEAIAKGETKLPHEQMAEELLAMVDAEKEQSLEPSKKRRKKRKSQAASAPPQAEEPSKKPPQKAPPPQTPSIRPPKKEKKEPADPLIFINQLANNHTLLEKRVARWGELSVDQIRKIPGYEQKSAKQALDIQARHHLKGVHALLQSDRLRETYTFPTCYKNDKGKDLSGRGILAALNHGEATQYGVVYIGWDETSGKIYHAFLEVQPKEQRRSLDELLRPKIYQHFRKAKAEIEKKGREDDWQFVSNTTFEMVVENGKSVLKMTQADSSGKKEILNYIFYPIR